MYGRRVESHESTRQRAKSLQSKAHEGRIARRGFAFMTQKMLCISLSRCHRQWRFWMQRLPWTKEWKKFETIPAWDLRKVKSKKEVILEAQRDNMRVHLASLMDIFHLENAELKPKLLKFQGRAVLRGNIVKDDSGAYAVFNEKGSSASQMTAAKIMDVTVRLPGCHGQAADAVSAYTQVKLEDAPKLLKNPKSESPDVWIRLPRHEWPQSI